MLGQDTSKGEIIISIDVTTFSNIVKRQSEDFCRTSLSVINLRIHGRDEVSRNHVTKQIKVKLKDFSDKTDRVVFISQVLIYLSEMLEDSDEIINDLDALELIQNIQHFLVRELEKMNVGVDKNAFSNDDIKNLTKKVNKIIEKLACISIGQEVIFDRIEELKNDYAEVLNSFGLGKKPFFQRFAGIIATYVGEKGADETIALLRPLIKDVWNNASKMLE